MPVELVPLAEIERRQRMLTKKAAGMPPGPERDYTLAEVETLRSLASLKQFLESARNDARDDAPCSPARKCALRYVNGRSG
jgi:hypothetical protein